MNFWLEVLPPLLAAIFIWWGSTGIIIYTCGRKAWRPWVFAFVTAIQPLAWWRLWAEKNSAEVGGVFASFFWAVVIWSWIETSYYTGFIVGRKMPELEPDAPTGLRFRQAVAANLYHELSITFLSLIVIAVGWGGANDTGLWAFMILHWTHQSAKINIFLGVNNLTTEYLPDNLKYMAQYFSRKSLNTFFPFSVSITTVIAVFLFTSIQSSVTAGQQVGQTLLFVMMVAAILEHWWLVTPIPSRIWEWALKSRRTEAAGAITPAAAPALMTAPTVSPVRVVSTAGSLPAVHIVCGYLGSGKTTVLRNILPQLNERVAVVVNDFGSVGVDAELLRSQGQAGAILELPGGCVCCTLQKNLAGQILKLIEDYQPSRILIEPSGVAGIEEIVRALANPRLAGKLGQIEVVAVVEAPRLLTPTGLQKFTLTQINAASAIIISKTDLVRPDEAASVVNLVANLNPLARIFPAIEGQVSARQLLNLVDPAAVEIAQDVETGEEDSHSGEADHTAGLISFAREYEGYFDQTALKRLFDRLAEGYFGPVERAKGLFQGPGGQWQAWDVAGGAVYCRLIPEYQNDGAARFMLVAHDLSTDDLNQSLEQCIIEPSQNKIRG